MKLVHYLRSFYVAGWCRRSDAGLFKDRRECVESIVFYMQLRLKVKSFTSFHIQAHRCLTGEEHRDSKSKESFAVLALSLSKIKPLPGHPDLDDVNAIISANTTTEMATTRSLISCWPPQKQQQNIIKHPEQPYFSLSEFHTTHLISRLRDRVLILCLAMRQQTSDGQETCTWRSEARWIISFWIIPLFFSQENGCRSSSQ